jgi:membrane peptidoglycan carboxypeptidase
MQARTAQEVRQMMITAVEQGSGQKAAVPGLVVGGKTGTAQAGGDLPPHAWFAGFAESGERGVVVVVMIENGGEGSQTAAPIFAEIAQVAMGQPNQSAPTPLPQPTAGHGDSNANLHGDSADANADSYGNRTSCAVAHPAGWL